GLLPVLGYQRGRELGDDDERRKRGLPARERMADLDDPVARQENYLSSDADWITAGVTVCTLPGQIALAPGAVVRRFSEEGRECSAFSAEGKILKFLSALSADFRERRVSRRDIAITIQNPH